MKEIPLTKGFVAIVDDEDFEKFSGFPWKAKLYKGVPYATRTAYDPERYAAGLEHKVTILLHREIAGALEAEDVDHENRNTLDNQKLNLRRCSRSQNLGNQKIRSTNKSGFKGVYWKSWSKPSGWKGGAWCSTICVNYKIKYLGYFPTAEEAAHAYDKAAKENFGEFARLNFPQPIES